MHEELFLNLLNQYETQGHSLDRILKDPRFKDLPLAEKVDLLKTHGHTIRNGSKTDPKFWKDLSLGVMGTAMILAEPLSHAVSDLKRGIHYGAESRAAYDNGISPGPPPEVILKPYSKLGIAAAGAGIAAPKFYQALAARRNMLMVKKLLKEQPGSNTQEDAINVLARS